MSTLDPTSLPETETIQLSVDDTGVVTLHIDDPKQGANTMRAQFVADFSTATSALTKNADAIKGVILTSGKSSFFAGGDLHSLLAATKDDADVIFKLVGDIQASLVALETLGKPVVAAIGGSALGGGLEITLACHHRVATENKRTKIGFPEVTLGLLPGAGGIVRSVRMLGVVNALQNVLIQGQQMNVNKAKEVGLIDAVVANDTDMLAAAHAFIDANPKAEQAWRAKGYKIPGGTPSHPSLARNIPAIPSTLKKQTKGAHYNAPFNIMAAAVEGAQVHVDRAFEIEARHFVDLVCHSPQSKNMIQAFFFDMQAINKGASRPDGFETFRAKKVAVLGAGMMGAGIAYQCARSKIDVVLKDVSTENAEKGKGYAKGLVDKAVSRKKMSREDADALLARIHPTGDAQDLKGCDLVIEAVFESPDLKQKVFQEIEDVVLPDALLASNTSTLPITTLAEGVKRESDFVGLHFFSPVDKMPLVEIVKGAKTSDAALARAVDVVQQIKKTPIVVNDSRGFFTSRVIAKFLNEAVAMVGEGLSPVMIERAGMAAGYPAPPLQLMDELTLTLPRKIAAQYRAAAEADGETYVPHPAEAVLDKMVEHDRCGRSTGGGFYAYDDDGDRLGLFKGLYELFDGDQSRALLDSDAEMLADMQDRMLFGEAIETVKCFDEGVLLSHADANIGSILGIGFPAWTGGVSQFIDQYANGPAGFVARADELVAKYGERFTVPESLRAVANAGGRYRPA